jgi:hypothetical protein
METTEDDMAQQLHDLKAVGRADEAAALLSNNLGMLENEDIEIDTTGVRSPWMEPAPIILLF